MKWPRRKGEDLKASYATVFGPKSASGGQDVFLDLYDKCGMAKTNFVAGEPDLSAFNDGCRSIFLYILQMSHEPEQIVERIKETESMEIIDD